MLIALIVVSILLVLTICISWWIIYNALDMTDTLTRENLKHQMLHLQYQKENRILQRELNTLKNILLDNNKMYSNITSDSGAKALLCKLFWYHLNGKPIDGIIKQYKQSRIVNEPGGIIGYAKRRD